MELTALWLIVRRRWWLIALPAVIAFVLTILTLRSIVAPPAAYAASIKFTASQKPGGAGTFQDQAYTPWLASEYAVNALASWMRTDSFAREVSAKLAGTTKPFTPDQVRGVIANSDNARSLMTLYLRAPDPDDVRAVGQAAIDVLAEKADAYFPQLAAPGQKVQVVPLDQVTPALDSPSITNRLAPLARVGIGLAFGLALAFLAEYLDRTLRTRAEVESLGLPVIAEIPAGRGA